MKNFKVDDVVERFQGGAHEGKKEGYVGIVSEINLNGDIKFKDGIYWHDYRNLRLVETKLKTLTYNIW